MKQPFLVSLFIISFCSFGQSESDKLNAIIDSLNLIESQKIAFDYEIQSLKEIAQGDDSLKLISLEKKLEINKIRERAQNGLKNHLTKEEIDDLYKFTRTTAFNKLKNINPVQLLSNEFRDIKEELDELSRSILEPKETKQTKQIVEVNCPDGFYLIENYIPNSRINEVELENTPILTTEDIKKVELVRDFRNKPSIQVIFTPKGREEFHRQTKNNINKPLAVVINKQIVTMPIITTPIPNGKAQISGDYTQDEIEEMIKRLQTK